MKIKDFRKILNKLDPEMEVSFKSNSSFYYLEHVEVKQTFRLVLEDYDEDTDKYTTRKEAKIEEEKPSVLITLWSNQ